MRDDCEKMAAIFPPRAYQPVAAVKNALPETKETQTKGEKPMLLITIITGGVLGALLAGSMIRMENAEQEPCNR